MNTTIREALELARKALQEVEWWGHIGEQICIACHAVEPRDHKRPMRHRDGCLVAEAITAIDRVLVDTGTV